MKISFEYQKLDSQAAFIKTQKWFDSKEKEQITNIDYLKIQKDINEFIDTIRFKIKNRYEFDKDLSLFVYSYFNNLPWFSERIAATPEFWNYISVVLFPDIVEERWGNSEDYFWKNPSRVYFGRLWWFVHLSWQGTEEQTKKILDSKNCSEDIILNLVERTGREGTYINVYRLIMKYYAMIPNEKIIQMNKEYKNETGKDQESVFRVIMKMNTAKVLVMEPGFCYGGERGYVLSLFKEIGLYKEEVI